MVSLAEKNFICNTIYKDIRNPYVSTDLSKGIYREYLDVGMCDRYPYLQVNPTNSYNSIVLDVDYDFFTEWDYDKYPTPNVVALNKFNGHAHLFYYLGQSGVHKNKNSSYKSLSYLSAVIFKLSVFIGSDLCYAGLVGKNALCDKWGLMILREQPYSLDELNDYCPQIEKDKRIQIYNEARLESRNCQLFDLTRLWAYTNVKQYETADSFFQMVLEKAVGYNAGFVNPLGYNEVKSVGKSVANWTWKNNIKWGNDMAWRREVAVRGNKKSAQVRREKAQEKKQKVLELYEQKMTPKEIVKIVDVSLMTVSRYLKEYKANL